MHAPWYNTTLRYWRRDDDNVTQSSEGSPNNSFAYQPLNNSASEFRVLILQPAEAFDVETRLMRCNLDLPPKFECLSYVWGKPELIDVIRVDDQKLFITSNLSYILRHLRLKFQSRLLWVDAVCINQCNKQERSAQVQHMGAIYGSCEKDLVWVGPYPFESWTVGSQRDPVAILKHGIDIMKQIELFLNDEELAALVKLLVDSPVWGRLWIMQEVSLAPRLSLIARHYTLDWEVVHGFLGDSQYADSFHAPFGHNSVEKLVEIVFSKAQAIEHQRAIVRDMKRGYTSTLLDVLARFRWVEATDPRDRIYGLLGLVNEEHIISVDYGKTPEEVFTDVSVFMIRRYGNLDILCQSPWSDLVYRLPSLPSWVPDFTCPGHPIPLFAQRSIFNAGDTTPLTRCEVRSGRELLLSGVYIDRLGPILPEGDCVDNYKLEHKYSDRDGHFLDRDGSAHSIPKDWMSLYFGERLLQSSETYFTGEACSQAFWRTLVADCKCYPIERLSPSDIATWGSVFLALMRTGESGGIKTRKGNSQLWMMLKRMVVYWTFTTTAKGFYAMVLCGAREGDAVAVLDGAKVPVILREVPGQHSEDGLGKFELVSTAYVHGFMDGEAYAKVEALGLRKQRFMLV
ncbi:heterokaryon incompatibility protein-domain-containing protein [Schizothecium vesticola]|uniref:Heterokaryon incompatibility protein-domain-containing protein n=1 Tax=Schizothecium vesticola TaxID=314040 RepID=A0AA40K7J9_9PEZI|nr:heterokaryon incompatibility protein-domain-containing protein [Schizothecium vesticola]